MGITVSGRKRAGQAVADRTALARGSYVPGPETTGPLPNVTSFTQVTPVAGGDGTYSFNVTDAGAVFDGYEFWGQVRPRVVSGETPVFRNCIFRGPPPARFSGGLAGLINAYGIGYGHSTFENCLWDPTPWFTQKGYDPNQWVHLANTTAIHGADFDMRWCEIRNVQDGFNLVGHTPRTSGGNVAERWTDIDRCWIHKGFYVNDWYGPSDGQPHGDAVQTNTGKNLQIRGSMLGGQRDMAGYRAWGSAKDRNRNTGDDFWNAGIMLQQEVSGADPNLIENVEISDNVFGGGTASLNHSSKFSIPWTGLTIVRNRFLTRGSDWGQTLNAGAETNQGAGYYVLRPSAHASKYGTGGDANTVYETGAPVPITNGG